MSIAKEYEALEQSMPTYDDYKDIPVQGVDEPLVPILASGVLCASTMREDARRITGEQTYVRQTVRERLVRAGGELALQSPGLRLEVGYGYRALSVQRARFADQVEQLSGEYSGEELRRAAHRQVAVPEFAGHPAGAAVDIRIIDENSQSLDFGTELWEFTKRSYTFSPEITEPAQQNRALLRSVMMGAGFAPFDGEWWHFSYGDKEWAYYYSQPQALYDQIEFKATDV